MVLDNFVLCPENIAHLAVCLQALEVLCVRDECAHEQSLEVHEEVSEVNFTASQRFYSRENKPTALVDKLDIIGARLEQLLQMRPGLCE